MFNVWRTLAFAFEQSNRTAIGGCLIRVDKSGGGRQNGKRMAHFDSLATVRRLTGTQSVRLELGTWEALYQNHVVFTYNLIRQVRDVLIQAGYDEIKITSRAPSEATCLLRLGSFAP